MKNMPALMSSKNPAWETPDYLFNRLNCVCNFTLDVCAFPFNAKCPKYITPAQDGLKTPWFGRCWMNPPYGREIGAWVKRAKDQAVSCEFIVCLLPGRIDTAWFFDHVYGIAAVLPIRGRLKFKGALYPAPFPSMLAIYNPEKANLIGLEFITSGKYKKP